jgi:hypothetical protein
MPVASLMPVASFKGLGLQGSLWLIGEKSGALNVSLP